MKALRVEVPAFQQAGVEFDPATHVYRYHGVVVEHHVTGVLRAHKISANWDHVPPLTLEAKRQIGQAVHAATHYEDEGDLDDSTIDPAIVPYLEAWRTCKRELDLEILLLETCLVHPLKRFAGMVDRFAIAHALQSPDWPCLIPAIVDLKTGDPDDAGADVQTAAYEELLRAVLSPALLDRLDLAAGWAKAWPRYSVQLLPTGRYRLSTYTSPRDGHRWNWALSLEASAHPSWKERGHGD